jgi:hypothetical protein
MPTRVELRRLRTVDVPTIRAVWWTLRAAQIARAQLRDHALADIRLPPAPRLPPTAIWGVRIGLRLSRETCLVRSLVRQVWHAEHGRPVDVVIGVTAPARFEAHAWLDGDPVPAGRFRELLRHPPP